MIYKLEVSESLKDSAIKWASEIGEVLFDESFIVFGTLKPNSEILETVLKMFPNSTIKNHTQFLMESILNGEMLLEKSTYISVTKPKGVTFTDLPTDMQKDLKDVSSVVSWLTAFLLAAGVQLWKLRKVRARLNDFVKGA